MISFGNLASAELVDNNDGTISDTDKGLMWVKDANLAKTEYYWVTENGYMEWSNAKTWVENLVYAGYDDWKLPSNGDCVGYNCVDSDMGHLYYTEFGNKAIGEEGWTMEPNVGPFINMQPGYFWTDKPHEEYASVAYAFNFMIGHQDTVGGHCFIIPVRDAGPIVPEPVSSLLFAIGGPILWFRKKLIK